MGETIVRSKDADEGERFCSSGKGLIDLDRAGIG